MVSPEPDRAAGELTDARETAALRVHIAQRWERVFAACAQLEIVKFDFDVDDHQGKVYVGVRDSSGDVVYRHLSDLTETFEVSAEDQRLRFSAHHAVWEELRAFPPLRYRPALARNRKLTRVEIYRDGISPRTNLWTNSWPPTEHDCRFLPWSAQWYPIGFETLRAVGVQPPADMDQWPPREVHGLW